MPESLPKRGAMAFDNLVRQGRAEVVASSASRPLFPASRLLDPRRSSDWRTLVKSPAQSVTLRLKEEALPGVVGMVDATISPGQLVVLIGADDQAFTLNTQAWIFTAYAQTDRGTMRWYPGTADLPPAAGVPHLYWNWTLPNNGSPLDHFRVGKLWMSQYLDLWVDEGYEATVNDASGESTSDGQVSYFDIRLPYQSVKAAASFMTIAEARAFRQTMDRLGRSNPVLLDLWARSTDAADKADGCYYGLLGRRGGEVASFKRSLAMRENMAYEFTELRG